MDKRIYLLTLVSFMAGMVELIIGGILDLVADDLNISLSQTGLFITIFSLVFAISGPVLLVATAKVERKKLMLLSLVVFFIGNVITIVSDSYSVIMFARILTAASAALLTILCITIASSIVEKAYIGRAVGLVVMGISGSLVLGVPIGLVLGNHFGWRAPFVLIAFLTICLMICIQYFMNRIQPAPAVPITQQLRTLKSSKILAAHLAMFLFLAGHTTLYAYFTPFLKTIVGVSAAMVSVIYFIYGIAAISGGAIGGTLADRFGARKVMIGVMTVFSLTMFIMAYTTFFFLFFLIIMIIWGMMSWTITPPMQNYLIDIAPETAAVQQSLSHSSLHFGIAFGSFMGGIIINHASVVQNAAWGSLLVLLALGSIIFSMQRHQKEQAASIHEHA